MFDGIKIVVNPYMPPDMMAMVADPPRPLSPEEKARLAAASTPEEKFVVFAEILGGRGELVIAKNIAERLEASRLKAADSASRIGPTTTKEG